MSDEKGRAPVLRRATRNVNLKDGSALVRPETSKVDRARTTRFHPEVTRELDRYLRTRPTVRDSDPMFPNDGGSFFTDSGIKKVFQRIQKHSGVKNFSAHIMRHVWATRFEGDLLELMRQGGWKDFKQVERYRKPQEMDRSRLFNPVGVVGSGRRGGTIHAMPLKRSA